LVCSFYPKFCLLGRGLGPSHIFYQVGECLCSVDVPYTSFTTSFHIFAHPPLLGTFRLADPFFCIQFPRAFSETTSGSPTVTGRQRSCLMQAPRSLCFKCPSPLDHLPSFSLDVAPAQRRIHFPSADQLPIRSFSPSVIRLLP